MGKAIEVLEVSRMDGGEVVAVYAKGHHDPAAFAEAAAAYLARTDYELQEPLAAPRLAWWRAVPAAGCDVHVRYLAAREGARGAFRVTAIDLETWEQ